MKPLRPLVALLIGASFAVATATAAESRAQEPDVRAKLVAPPAVAAGAKTTVVVEMTLGPKWHVNSHTPTEDFLIPTAVTLAASAGTLSSVRYPKGVERRFSFSDKPLSVYEKTVRFESDLALPAGASGKVSVTGTLGYQACNEQQCYAPARIPLAVTIAVQPAAPGPPK